MKQLIVKLLWVSVLFSSTQIAYSQRSTDGKFLFKMWFFIEHANYNPAYFRKLDFPTKDSTLFCLFNSVVDLNMDTLKSTGFDSSFLFLSIAEMKGNKLVNDSAFKYSKTPYLSYVLTPIYHCNDVGYVLCINKSSGTSYRLQGFSGNDFWSFFERRKKRISGT